MQIPIDQQHFRGRGIRTGAAGQASGDIQSDSGRSTPGLRRKESEEILIERSSLLVNCAIYTILKRLQRNRGNQELRHACFDALLFLPGLPACAESDDGGLARENSNAAARALSQSLRSRNTMSGAVVFRILLSSAAGGKAEAPDFIFEVNNSHVWDL